MLEILENVSLLIKKTCLVLTDWWEVTGIKLQRSEGLLRSHVELLCVLFGSHELRCEVCFHRNTLSQRLTTFAVCKVQVCKIQCGEWRVIGVVRCPNAV